MIFEKRTSAQSNLWQIRATLLLIIALTVIAAIALISMEHGRIEASEQMLANSSEQAASLNGNFNGTLVITAPVNIGVVDVTVQLTSTEGSSTGFVLDSATSHFAQNPAVNASIRGGTGDTPNFTIQSEPFVEVIAGQTITRSFSIDGQVLGDGAILTGGYAETIIGYTKDPLRIAGSVLLSNSAVGVAQVPSNPAPATPTPERPPVGTLSDQIYLPFVTGEAGNVSAAELPATAKQEQTQPPTLEHEVLLPVINVQ